MIYSGGNIIQYLASLIARDQVERSVKPTHLKSDKGAK